jgi:hypothetical protein
VLVLWRDQGPYPAYILAAKGTRRFRVHFDGYPDRCDEEVNLESIQGRVQIDGPSPPPPPRGVSCVATQPTRAAGAPALYKEADRVRVSWRGSTYPATIVKVIAHDRFLVHYDGHEQEWDEVVPIDRIVGLRKR